MSSTVGAVHAGDGAGRAHHVGQRFSQRQQYGHAVRHRTHARYRYTGPEAVDAAVALVHERFGDRGKILLRYGHRPKVAIPFQTDTPFKKIRPN